MKWENVVSQTEDLSYPSSEPEDGYLILLCVCLKNVVLSSHYLDVRLVNAPIGVTQDISTFILQ